MTRVEENEMGFQMVMESMSRHENDSYEDAVKWRLSLIGSVLADISKSLAIIADNVKEEGEKNEHT